MPFQWQTWHPNYQPHVTTLQRRWHFACKSITLSISHFFMVNIEQPLIYLYIWASEFLMRLRYWDTDIPTIKIVISHQTRVRKLKENYNVSMKILIWNRDSYSFVITQLITILRFVSHFRENYEFGMAFFWSQAEEDATKEMLN